MRKTKIICTLGPSTDKDGVLRELVANGMNVAPPEDRVHPRRTDRRD